MSADDLAVLTAASYVAEDENGCTDLGVIPEHIRQADFEDGGSLVFPNDAAPGLPPETAVCRSRLRAIEQMLALPPTRYIVRDLLPDRGLAAIYGAPAAGKSFLAIHLAFAVASGRTHWFGRLLRQAPVAYVALEGGGGMQKRIKACLAHTGDVATTQLRFFADNLSLLSAGETEALAREIIDALGAGAVTIIDTLSRASSGGDENSSSDMTTIIENAEMLGRLVAGPVVLVHHNGKEASKGLRGHSSLLGAVDAAVEVVNCNGNKSWTIKKNKDGEDGGVNAFDLVPYLVSTDQWGHDVRSLAVKPLLASATKQLPPVSGKNRIAVIAIMRHALAERPGGIAWDQATMLAASVIPASSGRRNTVATSTLKSLIGSGHLQVGNGRVCAP